MDSDVGGGGVGWLVLPFESKTGQGFWLLSFGEAKWKCSSVPLTHTLLPLLCLYLLHLFKAFIASAVNMGEGIYAT